MATNWVNLTGIDLRKVLDIRVLQDANQNTTEDATADATYDPTLENRADDLVTLAIHEIRAAIRNAGSVPLSLTTDTIPPEATRHCLNIAAYQLIISTPNLKMVIITDKGVSSPYAIFYKQAMEWVEKIGKGFAITSPTDPCGADWLNPVGTQLNAVPSNAVYDALGEYALEVAPGFKYTWNQGANDTSIYALGTPIVGSGSTFVSSTNQVILKGTANAAVTATLIFDNPPLPGMVRFGGTTLSQPVDMTTWDAPQPAAFDTSDLGQP